MLIRGVYSGLFGGSSVITELYNGEEGRGAREGAKMKAAEVGMMPLLALKLNDDHEPRLVSTFSNL